MKWLWQVPDAKAWPAAALSLACMICMSGCSGVGDVAGTASAVASGAVTGNPAVAIGVGGIVRGALDASSKAYARANARDTQAIIVTVAAALEPGQEGTWKEAHRLSADVGGRVAVVRVINSKLATCKEIAFTIDSDADEHFPYQGAICRTGTVWRWAVAEPSTERWSVLRN